MELAKNWKSYQCIDAGDGEKVEVWDSVILRRPDPIAMWHKDTSVKEWKQSDAVYHRSSSGGGHWEYFKKLPESWTIDYNDLTFKVSPTGFKHTGLFPEQAANWDWMQNLIKTHKDRQIKVLNLFAYTGGATMACAKAGAGEVVHVDASKGMVAWAKENRDLSNLQDKRIRFIVDDCLKFVEREKRRGHTYQGILMDPPSYGRGPNGEMWKFEKDFAQLFHAVADLLAEDAIFFLINSYTSGVSSLVLDNMMKERFQGKDGIVTTGDLAIPLTKRDMVLPCGIYARWETKK